MASRENSIISNDPIDTFPPSLFFDVDSWLIDPSPFEPTPDSSSLAFAQTDSGATTETGSGSEQCRLQTDNSGRTLGAEVWEMTVAFMKRAAETMQLQVRFPTSEADLLRDINGKTLISLLKVASEFVESSGQHQCKAEDGLKEAGMKNWASRRGRKPVNIKCFVCGVVFPFKRELIGHLRDLHQIVRSQSVMYKRIKEGEEVMRWRFWERQGKEGGLGEKSRRRTEEVVIS